LSLRDSLPPTEERLHRYGSLKFAKSRHRRFVCSTFVSRFSMSVALAQRIAGKARNKPAASGPNKWAMSPAKAVATKRKAYSYQRLCFRADHLREQPSTSPGTVLGSESDSKPRQHGGCRRRQRGPSRTHHKLADQETISREGQRAEDHLTVLRSTRSRHPLSRVPDECCKSHRRSGAE
jgi:hypothetical protein